MKHAIRTRSLSLLLVGLVLLAAACGGDETGAGDEERGEVIVGSTNFPEQEILASMYAAVLEQAGYEVERRFQLGSREVVLPALTNGEIDVLPEYVGTSLEFLNGGAGEATADTQESLELLQGYFADDSITVLEPADAENQNALVVTPETADELGLSSVSDLEGQAGDLVLGGPPECPQRPLCLPGYAEVYGLEFAEFVSLDAGGVLTIEALQAGDIDVALMFSSQGVIEANEWVQLEDDGDLQPAENLVPVVRDDVLNDEIADLLNEVSAALDTETLISLNRRVDVDGDAPQAVAEDFLSENGLLE